MGDILDAAKVVVDFVLTDAPSTPVIPDSVGDDEAIHAVQKHYGEAGFECDEDIAREVVNGERTEPTR